MRDLGPFAVLLRLAAVESGRQINVARLSQESGVPASTIKSYYQVLVDTFVGHWMTVYWGPHPRRGLLVCRCPEPQQLTKRVRAIPWDWL